MGKTSAIGEEGCPVYQCVGKTCKPTHVAVVIEEGECPKIECCEKTTTTVPTTTTTTVVPTTTTTVCSYCIDEVSGTRDIGEVWKNAKNPCKTHVCKFSENLCFVDTEVTSCKTKKDFDVKSGEWLKESKQDSETCCSDFEILPCKC